MSMTFLLILFYLLLLMVLVLVHELGHYLAAKRNRVLVEEFGIGIPPRAKGWKIGETVWSLNWLPIGGFVKLYGDGVSGEGGEIDPKLKDRAFIYKKPWQKIEVIVMGVVFNILLAWILTTVLFIKGTQVADMGVKVAGVVENSPAYTAGVQKDDVITAITTKDGEKKEVRISPDLQRIIKDNLGTPITLTVKRSGRDEQLTLTPRSNPPPGEGAIGISFSQASRFAQYPLYSAPYFAALETGKNLYLMSYEILALPARIANSLQGKGGAGAGVEVAGPIGIFKFFEDIVKAGVDPTLQFMILISLNLAIFNILPIPALDGGRLMFALYELFTGKRANHVIENKVNTIGFIALLGLAILIAIRDIIKLGQ